MTASFHVGLLVIDPSGKKIEEVAQRVFGLNRLPQSFTIGSEIHSHRPEMFSQFEGIAASQANRRQSLTPADRWCGG